ncbi:MAG: hypothetical protein D6820_13070 [Lentisphaerae bacterium]|nr:MAG: hypothetical protein D6820_13070 [Lentisphaerota bacterium]
MRLTRESLEYLVEIIGVDTGRIEMELEKLYCFAGSNPSLEQVKAACQGNREAHFFAVTQAICERKREDALLALRQTLDHTSSTTDSECIRLTRMTANQLRKMVRVMLAMHRLKCRNSHRIAEMWQRRSSQPDDEFLGCDDLSAWNFRRFAENAGRFSARELLQTLDEIQRIDVLNVSSSIPSELLLLNLILHTCK